MSIDVTESPCATPTAGGPTTVPPARPVHVCFMIDRLGTGGTETQLLALVRRLDRSRVRPSLCLLDGCDQHSRALQPDDCPVRRLGVRALARPRALGQVFRLARFLRRERVDVLQVYFRDSSYLGVAAGRLAGVPFILRTRNNVGHWMRGLDRRLGRLVTRLATATVANCEACRRSVIETEGADPARVFVLENGVDLERFLGVPPLNATRTGRPRVGAVANLRPVKGLEVLVDAAALVAADRPDVSFDVAGDGELRAGLDRQVERLGLAGRFHFRGAVGDVPALLATLDVAVLPSRGEGMPNAVLEYMAAGRPIVATAVGATPELIEDGRCGLLVPPGDARALAAAIGRLVTDRALAARLGEAARRRARERYGRGAMVERFERFYEDLVAGRMRIG